LKTSRQCAVNISQNLDGSRRSGASSARGFEFGRDSRGENRNSRLLRRGSSFDYDGCSASQREFPDLIGANDPEILRTTVADSG
jgi:hypothetical protein